MLVRTGKVLRYKVCDKKYSVESYFNFIDYNNIIEQLYLFGKVSLIKKAYNTTFVRPAYSYSITHMTCSRTHDYV